MRRLLTKTRPTVTGIAVVAVLSLVGTATANRMIRDGSINTRDIKDNQVNTRDLRNNSITTRDIRDNQVNTRDLRDGAIRGVDVHDGSLEPRDLEPATAALLGTATLIDPRAHDQDPGSDGGVAGHACCISWTTGPAQVSEVASSAANPIPGAGSGQAWRSVVLEPGAYVLQSTAYADKGEAGAEGVATRLFLGGSPLIDGGGYSFVPVSSSGLPEARSTSTAIEVPAGSPAQRQLVERAISLGNSVKLADNFLIWKVTPR